jgi:hypothetical protein
MGARFHAVGEIACLSQLSVVRRWNRNSGQRKVLSVKRNALNVPLALALVALAAGQHAVPRSPSGGISGLVRYPDGAPSDGATVSAITDCKDMGYNLVQEVKTLTDGSFYIPAFLSADCKKVRLSAKKVEDLWLKTGHDVFYEGDNGTTPVVEAPQSGSPTTTEITLGNRGGSVSFRVWDVASHRFIYAELHVKRIPVPGAVFGSMQIATGRDGSPDTLLLPAGQYEISVEQYSCREAIYFTASPPQETLTVEAGERLAKDLSVDVRLIKPMKSYDNPRGRPCEP